MMLTELVGFRDTLFSRLCYLASLIVLIVIFFLLKDAIQQFKRIRNFHFRLVWLLTVSVFITGLWLCYPGLMVGDDAWAVRDVFQGYPHTWLSLSYSYLLASGYVYGIGAGFIPVLSIGIFSYLLLRVIRIISESTISINRKWLCVILLCGLSLNPLMQGLLLFHARDIVFSLAVAFIGLVFFEPAGWTKKEIIFLSALVVYLGDLRAEGKIHFVVIPVLFYFCRKWNFRQTAVSVASLVLLGFIYLAAMPRILEVNTLSINYKITTWVMPLSQIYHDLGVQNIDTEINEKINPVLDVNKLEKHFSAVDIDAFHAGAFNRSTTQEQWSEFKTAALKLMAENAGLVLKNRINLFLNMLNVKDPTFIYYDDFHKDEEHSKELRRSMRAPDTGYAFEGVSEFYYKLLGWWGDSRNIFIQIFNSLALPLAFSLFCLSYIKSKPEFFCFAVLVLTRVPVMFLFAPASYLRYLFTLLLFFVFAVPLLLMRMQERTSQTQDFDRVEKGN